MPNNKSLLPFIWPLNVKLSDAWNRIVLNYIKNLLQPLAHRPIIILSISRLLVLDCCNFNSCCCVISYCAAFVLVTCVVIFFSVSYKSKSKSDLTSKSHSEVLFKISKPLFANRCFEYFKKKNSTSNWNYNSLNYFKYCSTKDENSKKAWWSLQRVFSNT